MTFEEFLKLVRERIGSYCTDEYWAWKYNLLEDKSKEYILQNMYILAINAVATDYSKAWC